MAGPTVGLTGAVTSWGSNGTFADNIAKDLNLPAEFTLDMDGVDLDVTPFVGPTIVETHTPGLRSWGGTITGFLGSSSGQDALGGAVATAEYDLNVRSWNMTLTARELDVTSWTNLSTRWMAYAPGLVSWSGSYEAIIDNATALSIPSSSTGTGTFTISSGNYWEGSIFSTRVGAVVRVGDVNIARYDFRGTGHLTVVGSNAGMPANSGSVATPIAETMVLTAYTGRTYTGSAFWRSIQATCNIGQAIQTVIGFRGSGALTPA
jgi:hypothetical protein